MFGLIVVYFRLARLSVKADPNGVRITPQNVAVFTFDKRLTTYLQSRPFFIDGRLVERSGFDSSVAFIQDGSGAWKVCYFPLRLSPNSFSNSIRR